MTIWVDADACPRTVRDILLKAAERTATPLVLVANQPLSVPRSPHVRTMQVARGFDVADDTIAARAGTGDLVITSDIPLANDAIGRGADVLTPRGERLTTENVRARLNMRDFLDTMRSSGAVTGGPPALTQADRKQFADALDRWLARARTAP